SGPPPAPSTPTGPDWSTPPRSSRAGVIAGVVLAVIVVVAAGVLAVALDGAGEERTDTFPDVEAVTLDLRTADVELVVGDAVTVHSEVRTGRLGGTASTEVVDGRLRVSYECRLFAGLGFGLGCSGEYRIVVPPGMVVDGATGNGDVRVTGTSGPVTLRTSNGQVHLAEATGRVEVHTSNGRIVGTDLATSQLDASTSNGSVVLGFAVAPDRVGVDTSNGAIEVVVPDDGSAFALDTDTSNGDVTTSVPTDPSSPRQMRLHTSNGDVTVRAR
ncbi:DUF4097 family beta strand repeat-containing protein, partial [Salsipaludibacter albus]|uniref:DUF4097 family beta strand repeat-containing protein n=1 Tax=Salsipaludibacter albus TaxID=2849650 RepID=UPI001EE44CAA